MVQDLKRSETGLYHVPLAFQCIYRWSDERGKNGDREVGREGRLPGLLYADELVLCGESEEDQRAMVECLLRCIGEEV